MQAAGLSQFDASGYLNDLCSPRYVGSERHLHPLRAMDWQVHRIRCALSKAHPWEALVGEFVELQRLQFDVCRSGDVQPSEFQSGLLRLYSTYVDEWQSFSARRLCLGAAKIA